jgi:hypothetical protein
MAQGVGSEFKSQYRKKKRVLSLSVCVWQGRGGEGEIKSCLSSESVMETGLSPSQGLRYPWVRHKLDEIHPGSNWIKVPGSS